MKNVLITAIAAAVSATGAAAQELVTWNSPSAATGQYAYFPMGTELRLTNRIELNTKSNHAGDRFYLEVAEPLTYRGQVVVPAGATAVGEVMRAEANGHFGKKGKLDVRLLYVQTPHGPVRLSGRTGREGKGQGALSIVGGVLVAWPMIFIHGTSGRLPANTPITAQFAEDLRFAMTSPSMPTAMAAVPDGMAQGARVLPARFDPNAFRQPR